MSTVCYEIDKDSKAMLMEKFPPKYPEVKYDHVTICMGGLEAQTPEPAEKVEVVGIADDGNGIEALIVKVNDLAVRNDGKPWHITASYDTSKLAPAEFDVFAKPGKEKAKPYKPVTSNGFLAQVLDKDGQPKVTDNPNWKVKMFDKPIKIQTHPKVQYDVLELKKIQEMGMSI
ncbi:MAG: hypothetical protein IJZ30_03065 [Alphaproteobacteria bacterium]|nr:hypothetical protein [Alphaproteobacteria bacterium]